MKKEELIKKLEELDYPAIEVAGHRRRLKMALLSSGFFRKQRVVKFFPISNYGIELSRSRRILIPLGILIMVALGVIWRAGLSQENPARVLTTTSSPTTATGEGLAVATPFLRIIEPMDNATINASLVSIHGKTEPGATVSINDGITIADAQGDFSFDVSLDDGINVINITVSNTSGGQATTTIVANSKEGA